jgi:hypothetical protein
MGILGFAIAGLFFLSYLLGASFGNAALGLVFVGLGLLGAMVKMLPGK